MTTYTAIEKTARKTTLHGRGEAYTYWAVETQDGGLYANISDTTVEGEGMTAREYAEALAFALNARMDVSLLGGLTTDQYVAARGALLEQRT